MLVRVRSWRPWNSMCVPLSHSVPGEREIITSWNSLGSLPGGEQSQHSLLSQQMHVEGASPRRFPVAPEPGAASPDALLLSSTFVGRGAGKECQGMVLTTQFSRVWQGFCVLPLLSLSSCWQRWSRRRSRWLSLHVSHPQGIPEAMSQVIGKTVCPLA